MTKTCILFSIALCMATGSVNAQRTYLDQTTIDRSIKPGNDFFAYANGGSLWHTAHPKNSSYHESLLHLRSSTGSVSRLPRTITHDPT